MDGNFSMTVAANGILHISYIGYVDQDIAVAGKSLFNIQLLEDTEMLDEVVVIGYGTVKRRDLTGAIASVKGDEVAANPVSNVAQGLAGTSAGCERECRRTVVRELQSRYVFAEEGL